MTDNRAILPEDFAKKMTALLGEKTFQAFLSSYSGVPKKGLRANTLKAGRDEMIRSIPFETQPIPWCDTGVYIDADERPGKQLAYNAGLYYVQEPSAMIPAAALAPQPGERVLDMCAAPGGKTTQLACALEGQGLLIANEVVKTRAKVLASNVERMGIVNAAITNVRPDQLVDIFGPASFDKILVDAPCSGEGMFRKDPAVAEAWSLENVAQCARRQKKMLETVDILLKAGGELVYSTCTFAPEEDEQIVEYLIETGKYEVLPIDLPGLPDHGRPEWTRHSCEAVEKAVRVMPHRVEGEGHFIAKLKKVKDSRVVPSKAARTKKRKHHLWRRASKKDLKDYYAFCEAVGLKFDPPQLIIAGDKLAALPEGLYIDQLDQGKWVRTGLEIGTFKKGRFEPAHTLAMALTEDQIGAVYHFKNDEEAYAYLKGAPISNPGTQKGWVLMCWHGYPLGWGKASGGEVKNHLPKGLRILKK